MRILHIEALAAACSRGTILHCIVLCCTKLNYTVTVLHHKILYYDYSFGNRLDIFYSNTTFVALSVLPTGHCCKTASVCRGTPHPSWPRRCGSVYLEVSRSAQRRSYCPSKHAFHSMNPSTRTALLRLPARTSSQRFRNNSSSWVRTSKATTEVQLRGLEHCIVSLSPDFVRAEKETSLPRLHSAGKFCNVSSGHCCLQRPLMDMLWSWAPSSLPPR